MKKSWHNKYRFSALIFLFFLLCCSISKLSAVKGQFYLSPYFDSNVQESLNNPEPTYGIKLRGNLAHAISRSRWKIFGDLLTQTFLDVLFINESKLVIHTEMGLQYRLLPELHLLGQWIHFQKEFYEKSRSYRWSEFRTYLQISPSKKFTAWIGYLPRSSTFITYNTIRFYEDNWEVRTRHNFTSRLSLEGSATISTITYEDYPAWGMVNDTLRVPLDFDQKDKSMNGLIHFRYQGKIIVGVQVGYESVSSNSVIGEFDLISFRGYLSGRIGKSNFYHLVLQRMDKNYQYPRLRGIAGYRDPEEKIQNRTYVQFEHVLKNSATGFIQISFLENETILNLRYYDKTLIEIGVKYEL